MFVKARQILGLRRLLVAHRASLPSRTFSVLTGYKEKVTRGELTYDEKQYTILQLFDKLQQFITRNAITIPDKECKSEQPQVSPAVQSNDSIASKVPASEVSPSQLSKRLRGVYLYGEVGTGKTMLMDQFYNNIDCSVTTKRRVHFHDFMLEIHKRIHLHKKKLIELYGRDIQLNLSSERDSIVIIAREIAQEARLLCFDEFQVTDICDAMILSRLFNELWKQGVVLVATSNRHPSELYLNGLNRQYFLPFIENLQANCIVRNIGIDRDYRQENVSQVEAYFVPNSAEHTAKLWDMYSSELVRANEESRQETVPVMMGRTLTLKHANVNHKVCFESFAELCETDKGASDYQALCTHYNTVYMHSIPQLSVLAHNEARRFITLVDALYNFNVRFVWAADAHPAQLFRLLSVGEACEQGQPLGTDHAWGGGAAGSGSGDRDTSTSSRGVGGGDSGDSSSSDSSGHITPVRHLRGQEQVKVTFPLDSNVYFGSTVKLSTSSSPSSGSIDKVSDKTSTAAGDIEDYSSAVDSTTAIDAGQEELKLLEGELASIRELSFAFKRAASRLTEMSSVYYFQKWELKYLCTR